VFVNGAAALAYAAYVGAVLAVVDAVRRRRADILAVAAISLAWMLVVAALAQKGFTGNLRYVLPPAALLCVLAGPGWTALLRGRGPVLAIVAAAAMAPGLVIWAGTVAGQFARLAADERVYDELPSVIERAGGEAAIRRCGGIFTGPFQTQALAWELHTRQRRIGLDPTLPGTIIARPGARIAGDARFEPVLRSEHWIVRQDCG
jgi:hypothetical protein